MFESFYGLREDPFRLSSDHRFCFPHRSYARARAYVDYALHRAEGFVLVTGSPGTGKTTLINELLSNLPAQTTRAATLLSTRLEAEDLLRMTAYAFGLKSREQPKAMLLQQLMEYVSREHRRGVRVLLIIDEAQDLSASALEELRLLTNLHESGRPLLQIVLVGQEALRELVRRPEMEQLHQRLIAAWHLQPLAPHETIGYVRHRLETAGWQGDPLFEPGVMETVFGFSQGVPRRINLICSRLLLHGCIAELHALTREDALELVRELGEEELLPPGNDVSPKTQAELDWSAIDQGLVWTPPVSKVQDDGIVDGGVESRAEISPSPIGPDSPSAPQSQDELGVCFEAMEEAGPSSRQAGSGGNESCPPGQPLSQALDQEVVDLSYSTQLDAASAGARGSASDQPHVTAFSPPPGLAIEDSSQPLSTPSAVPAATLPRSFRRDASRRQRTRRRAPLIVAIIAFFVLSLVPRDVLEWSASVVMPLINSLAISVGVYPPSG
jgi:type II secretory pathway predicted ATPase ExeA